MNIMLSICIPTYNRCKCLKRQVEFLLKERNRDIEIVISDNCSSDSTRLYLESLQNIEHLKWNINDVNLGTEGNMYECAKLANGEYIYFLSDDDYLKVGFLDRILELIKKYHADYYHFNYQAIDDVNYKIYLEKGIIEDLDIFNRQLSKDDITKLVSKHYGSLLFISSNVYKRGFVLKNENEKMNWIENLRLSIYAMSEGRSYFDNDVYILGGVYTSWSDKRGEVWFESFPKLYDSLDKIGFNDAQISRMKDYSSAQCIFSYFRSKSNKISATNWNNKIFMLLNIRVLGIVISLYIKRGIKKIVRIISNKKLIADIDADVRRDFRL